MTFAGGGSSVAVNYIQANTASPSVQTVYQLWYYSGSWTNVVNILASAQQTPAPSDAGYCTSTGDPFTRFTNHSPSLLGVYQTSGAICLTRLDVPGTGTITLTGTCRSTGRRPAAAARRTPTSGSTTPPAPRRGPMPDLTTLATNTYRVSTGITSWTPGTYYVATVIGTKGSTAGGFAFCSGGEQLGTPGTLTQNSGLPARCSSLHGSATSLPSSLTFSSFAKNYYYMWAALD